MSIQSELPTLSASIVIPTYNGKEKVCALLRTLSKQLTSEIEIIVVVDGSTDNTSDEIEKSHFEIEHLIVINQENKGRSGARNTGAALARGNFIIFFDDDIIPSDGLINSHLKAHVIHDIVVGALKSYDRHGNKEMFEFSEYLNQKWNVDIENNTVPYITAANFSIKKKVFQLLGGFDFRLNDSEDLDLAIRLTMKGYQIVYHKELIAYIPLNASFSETFNRIKEYKKGREVLNATNPSVKDYLPAAGIRNPLKRFFFFFFSFSFLYHLADKGFFIFMPKSWRMKLYDWMMTGNMMY